MKKIFLYLTVSVIIISCSKDEETSGVEIKNQKEHLLCKKWERTYLTINDNDTNYSEGWLFEREFFKDKTYIKHITKLGDAGEEDNHSADTSVWRWVGESYNAIEVNTWYEENKWYYSKIKKLTETELILEKDIENEGVYRFHYRFE